MAVDAAQICGGFWNMKACTDEFWPNTSQADYFEEFWTITSKINPEIEVRKQQESLCAIRRVGYVCHTY